MKDMRLSLVLLIVALSGLTARAGIEDESLSATAGRPADTSLSLTLERPNEVVHGDIVYSGVFVQMAKSNNPLELINPLAPAEAGSALDNTVFNPINDKHEGIKLFAINF